MRSIDFALRKAIVLRILLLRASQILSTYPMLTHFHQRPVFIHFHTGLEEVPAIGPHSSLRHCYDCITLKKRQRRIASAIDADMVGFDDDEDIDIKLLTVSVQIGLVSYSQTLFSILLREQTTRLICFIDVEVK